MCWLPHTHTYASYVTEMASVFCVSFGIAFGILFLLRQYMQFKWGKCKSKKSMRGKTVIITGANSGLGKRTALELAKRDARIILACRNVANGKEAADEISRQTFNRSTCSLVVMHLDLSSFDSIHRFVRDIMDNDERVDVLINNAAVGWCPFSRTEDGFERQFGVNHLGHFLLTNLLLDALQKVPRSRIISSSLYKKGNLDDLLDPNIVFCSKVYDPAKSYVNSKLANIIFGQELSRHVTDKGIDVFTISPGLVWTNLSRHRKISLLEKLVLGILAVVLVKTSFEGCQTILHCVLDDEVEGQSGGFFQNCTRIPLKEEILDSEKAKLFWDLSAKFAKLEKKTNSIL